MVLKDSKFIIQNESLTGDDEIEIDGSGGKLNINKEINQPKISKETNGSHAVGLADVGPNDISGTGSIDTILKFKDANGSVIYVPGIMQ